MNSFQAIKIPINSSYIHNRMYCSIILKCVNRSWRWQFCAQYDKSENMNRFSYLVLVPVLMCATFFLTPGLQARNSTTSTARSASQLYSKYCVSCHGRDGKSQTSKGKYNHARNLTEGEWQDDVSDERIFNSIMNGRNVRGNMPGFGKKINQQEADALVGFVRGLRK